MLEKALYGSIYMTLGKRQNYRDTKHISGCQRLEGEGEVPYQGTQGIFKGDGNSLYFDNILMVVVI